MPDGSLQENDLEKVRKEPYPILDSFEWVTMDLNDESQVLPSIFWVLLGYADATFIDARGSQIAFWALCGG